MIQDHIFGIDLGTSNCCIALWNNGTYTIIQDEYNNKTFPSIVGFTDNNKYIGVEVIKRNDIKSENIIYGIKRIIGKKYNEIDEIKNNVTYKKYWVINSEYPASLETS